MQEREQDLMEKVNKALSRIPRLQAKVSKVHFGHTYCRCYLEVGPTVKQHKIQSYAEYLARELRLHSMPIIHTIFREGAIVIDIPNTDRETVYLEPHLKSEAFRGIIEKQVGLPYIIGVNNEGEVICGDLTKAPHMLIAGQSGSGKSVVMRSVLNSMIAAWANLPMRSQLILFDPKGVELIQYRELPEVQMYSSSPEGISKTLAALVEIMEQRYEEFVLLADVSGEELYDIEAYNRYCCNVLKAPRRTLPYITVFMDELADILLNDESCEKNILRLVQKSRAAGIHLVVATQRPSSDIISGPIRANIPIKICCKVAQPIDGRVVFGDKDHGAHRLLGQGDLLYLDNTTSEPVRLQGAYTDNNFIRRYLEYQQYQEQRERQEFLASMDIYDPEDEKVSADSNVIQFSDAFKNGKVANKRLDTYAYSIDQAIYG